MADRPLFPRPPLARRARPSGPAPRRRRRRTALQWWAATALAAASTFTAVSQATESAAAARRAWGETATVTVARRLVPAGAVVEPGDIDRRTVPRRLVPRAAVAVDAVGQTARQTLHPGEIVLAARLAPVGLSGVAALLPEGTRALAVPGGAGTPPLQVGDRVDVLATFDVAPAPEDAGHDGIGHEEAGAEATGPVAAPTFAVARAGLVVHRDDETVTVAVTVDEASRVAFALARGTVVLALAGA